MSSTTEIPEFTVYDTDRGFFYVPFISSDGRVGYRVARSDDASRETFIYLNPSDGGMGEVPDVFVYQGIENDPSLDEAVVFVVPEVLVSEPA